MVNYPFDPASELEEVREYQKEKAQNRQYRRDLIAEVEKATGKKLITVNGEDYYVDPEQLNLLLQGGKEK